MRSLDPARFYRALVRRPDIAPPVPRLQPSALRPSVYVDAAFARVVAAIERQAGLVAAAGFGLAFASANSRARRK